jgi:hypothetical protein
MTLHIGKTIKKPILEPYEKDDESILEGKKEVQPEHYKEKTNSPTVLPFPHAMTNQRKMHHNSKSFKNFK